MRLQDELEGQEFEQIPIKVTSGVLIHIGAGIYNSLAGAIKELVSNAYDADATRVVISTDYQRFERIRVVDNGTGMTHDWFRRAMQSIGSSLKGVVQPSRVTPRFRRPIIGHLGIGLMALSQVCDSATIESQVPGSSTKFVAELDFSDFRRRKQQQTEAVKLDVLRDALRPYGGLEQAQRRLAALDPQSDECRELGAWLDIATRAERQMTERGFEDLDDEHLGYCVVYPSIQATPGQHGTTITLDNLDASVRSSLMDEGRGEDPMPKHLQDEGEHAWRVYRDEVNAWSWEDLCERLRFSTANLTYQSLPKYHQFLWELAAMTPVSYLKRAPVLANPDVLASKKRELAKLKFSVMVDNRYLRKPALLPSGALARSGGLEDGYDYYVQPVKFRGKVDDELLRYNGYLFWQRRQVEPSSLRGIQIYIRNVGIGVYDRTLLGFSTVNPTSRAGQISGEIYVEEGLERALNVDRNSFRETDPHYVALQEHVWQLLGSAARGRGLMGRSVDAYWLRKDRAEAAAHEEHLERLRELVNEITGGRIAVRFSDEEGAAPYQVRADEIVVYDGSPAWPRSRSTRHLYQHILVAVRAAIAAGASTHDVVALLERTLLRR